MSDNLRFVVIFTSGFVGMCMGGGGWFCWWTNQMAKLYPTDVMFDLPSKRVFLAGFWSFLGTPLAAFAGAIAGVGCAAWLARRRGTQ